MNKEVEAEYKAELARLRAQVEAMREVVEATRDVHDGSNYSGCAVCIAINKLDTLERRK